MKKIIDKFNFLMQEINANYIDEHAAACSYYTILSFIPLTILILTLAQYFGINEEVFIFILEGMIPSDILNEAVISIVKETFSKSITTITISAIFTFWSAGKGLFALCKGLNVVYGVKNENKYYLLFRIRALISTIIFIVVIVLTLLVLVFGNSINLFLQERFNIFSTVINLLLKSKILISIISLSIILTFVYRFIPKHKYKLKNQIPGAVIAAVLCNVVSIFYSIYVEVFTGFSLMYGSLTTIVLAMMWVYACMYSILIGAMFNRMILKKVKVAN